MNKNTKLRRQHPHSWFLCMGLGLLVALSSCSEPEADAAPVTSQEPAAPASVPDVEELTEAVELPAVSDLVDIDELTDELADEVAEEELFENASAVVIEQAGDADESFETFRVNIETVQELSQSELDCTTQPYEPGLEGSFVCAPGGEIEELVVVIRLAPESLADQLKETRSLEANDSLACLITFGLGDDLIVAVRTADGRPSALQLAFIEEIIDIGGELNTACRLNEGESTGVLPGDDDLEITTEIPGVVDKPADFWVDVFDDFATCHRDMVPDSDYAQEMSFTCINSDRGPAAIFAISTANAGEVDAAAEAIRNDDPDGFCWPVTSHANWVFAFGAETSGALATLIPAMNATLAVEGTVVEVPC